jgi:hypothetical protein
MKYIKTYEEQSEEEPLQIGEFVICYEENDLSGGKTLGKEEINKFFALNIGQIVEYDDKWYEVEFENIPNTIDTWFHGSRLNCRVMKRSEMIQHSKNKEDLLPYINQNKYNL